MAATVDYVFAYDATTHCVADHMYQGIADAYILDPKVQNFVQKVNPWALRDMAERLLEAHQRGLWHAVGSDVLDALRQVANEAEGILGFVGEARAETREPLRRNCRNAASLNHEDYHPEP